MTARRALAGRPRQTRYAGYHDEGQTCSRLSASLYQRSRKGRFRSGQTGQTVNLLALRLRWFESSPAHFDLRATIQNKIKSEIGAKPSSGASRTISHLDSRGTRDLCTVSHPDSQRHPRPVSSSPPSERLRGGRLASSVAFSWHVEN